MQGKPVIKGTRIPVYIVLNLLAGGIREEEILREYPDLVHEDILACSMRRAWLKKQCTYWSPSGW